MHYTLCIILVYLHIVLLSSNFTTDSNVSQEEKDARQSIYGPTVECMVSLIAHHFRY